MWRVDVRRVDDAELRLSVLAVIAAVADDPVRCASVLDEATRSALQSKSDLVGRLGARRPILARFHAARVITSLCGACGACARGRPDVASDLMTDARC